jgi:plastocyanin
VIRDASTVLLVAVLGTFGCGGSAPPPPTPPPTAAGAAVTAPLGTARITGRIRFEGTPPAPRPIQMLPECAALHPEGVMYTPVKVKDAGLADAVVYVKSGYAGASAPSSQSVLLDQTGCLYAPTSVAVQVGQPLLVRNSDTFAHNVHIRPNQNQSLNQSQPRKDMETTQVFDKEETLMPVGCDIHPWMRSYVSAIAHPFFAVSKEDGSFEIVNLPAGEYVIEAVHPKLQPVTGKATVKDGGTFTLDLVFKG